VTTAFQPDLFQSDAFQIDGGVVGVVTISISATQDGDTGVLTVNALSAQRPAGRPRRKKRERYLARYKGQYYEFETVEDLEAFVEKAKADEAPKPKKQRAPIKITLSPEFEEEIAPMVNIPPRIEFMPTGAALAQIRKIDYTLERFLAEAQRKADEEEAEMEELLMLLL
jgi:hypothetical protein